MHALHKLLLFHLLTGLGQDAPGGKIINGKIAPENSMLYMASLRTYGGNHVCGGFLIREDFVLTAAHCDCQLAKVVLGTHNLKDGHGIETSIAKKCIHQSYVDVGTGNDIMLLKLSGGVSLGKRVQLIELTCYGPGENQKCEVAGWGMIKSHSRPVYDLRVVDVSTINQKVCERQWGHLPDNIICAGGYNTTKGFCQGDSGGPLVCNGKAVGIVSFNRGGNCDYPNFPNVYTDISKFLPWINNILNQKDC